MFNNKKAAYNQSQSTPPSPRPPPPPLDDITNRSVWYYDKSNSEPHNMLLGSRKVRAAGREGHIKSSVHTGPDYDAARTITWPEDSKIGPDRTVPGRNEKNHNQDGPAPAELQKKNNRAGPSPVDLQKISTGPDRHRTDIQYIPAGSERTGPAPVHGPVQYNGAV